MRKIENIEVEINYMRIKHNWMFYDVFTPLNLIQGEESMYQWEESIYQWESFTLPLKISDNKA